MTDPHQVCPIGMYYVMADGSYACRCLICPRCHQHTGNAVQGHFWSWCRVTGDTRTGHFCCPDDCQLGPSPEAALPSNSLEQI